MKRNRDFLFTALKAIVSKFAGLIVEFRLATRLFSIFLIIALLMPLFFFGGWNKIFARVRSSPLKTNPPAPVSNPPLPYKFSGSSSNSSPLNSNLALAVSNSASSLIGFVTPPTLPEGFEAVRPVSPIYASVSSSLSSVGSVLSPFLGLFSTTNSAPEPLPTASSSVEFDFDGDNKADLTRFEPSSGEWKVKNSNGGSYSTYTLGNSNSVLAPGDYNGDGTTDVAIFSAGTWTVNPSGGSQYTVSWGASGDKPVAGDYNGDGRSDYALYRPSTNTWWILYSNTLSNTSTSFGTSGDITVQGDYDGDGTTDVAMFRPSTGDWHVIGSTAGYSSFNWGLSTDVPVSADYDADGKTDYAVYRPSTGSWYAYKSSGGGYMQATWGNYGDQPVPADYDGDGYADISVWRPKTGSWYIVKSSDSNYIIEQLGATGDIPVESAYLKKIGSEAQEYGFAKERLSPKNSTGGTNLYSRNFSWGTGLVGLPGRAGLDAGFGLSYNSLVWQKYGSTMYFDPDTSNVSPGFRLGFPTIEPIYYDGTTGKYSYLMVTPSGSRIEFQQIGASNTFETANSSYVELKMVNATNPNDPVGDIPIIVTGTDGTQMEYEWIGGAYRCEQIKDRNGNYISIQHNAYGQLETLTDTLGREITVNYDYEYSPTSITQQWRTNNGSGSATTRTYATFSYTAKTVSPSFDSSLAIYGPSGTSVKVLDKIIYGTTNDNTGETHFEYNDFGQVKKVRNFADGTELNYVATNLDTPGTGSLDVPRLSQTRSWVKNFNLNTSGVEQEVVLNNTLATGHEINISGTAEDVTLIQVSMVGHPHGNVTNTYVGESGWQEGLPILTDDYANDEYSNLEKKRWFWRKWTQDNESLGYIQNPRVVETRVGDEENSNIIRTEIDYLDSGSLADFGLTEEVRIYDHTPDTLLKKSVITYEDDTAFLSKRIIGLPSTQMLYDGSSALMSKASYQYDEGDFSGTGGLQQNISPTQHDTDYYSSSFITGRGNLTSVSRYDVSNSNTVTSSLKYNTAGAAVARTSPWTSSTTRTIKIDYTDNFNNTGDNQGTYAYPKTVTDPAGFSSTIKYRYDIGANVEAVSPTPHGSGLSMGKKTTRLYDEFGRPEKETATNTGAYTRYEYPDNQIQSLVYSTITDTNSNGADSADEVLTESWTDGAGRVIKARSELPGSSGGYSGSLVEYDKLGRVTRSTVPTEIDSGWDPDGDDDRGLDGNNDPIWLWTSQEYDWKNRTTKKINTDGTFQTVSYEGCGCAGGQITTVKGEEIFETDWGGSNPTSLGKRTQKIYQDILGRAYKTEVMKWNGTSVYSRTETTFNGRDQATFVTKTEIDTSVAQDWEMTYDGYGRLKTHHRPEQINVDTSDAYTTYNYNPDDSIESVVDARGATTDFEYNTRGLVDTISYSVPSGSEIAVPDDIEFEYDDAGNRMKMTDGLGTVDYTYTELSQLKTEKRTFNDTLADAPAGSNAFVLEYDFTLSGQLKFVKDPYGQQFNYSYDKVGRLGQVAGSTAFNGITTYASNPAYNARGTLTALDYGNGVEMAVTGFNNKLQANGFEVRKNTDLYIQKEYEFYEDGSLKFVDDGLSEVFDRAYKYDFAGRTDTSEAGTAARGETSTAAGNLDRPYTMNFTHDAFGHITGKSGHYYNSADSNSYSYNASNRNPGWVYDVEGNIVSDDDAVYQVDAAGRVVETKERELDESTEFYPPTKDYFNGNGHLEKRVRNAGSSDPAEKTNYYIRSSILNKVISETDDTGKKLKTFVPANGTTLATQSIYYTTTPATEVLTFSHIDASGTGAQETFANGNLYGNTTNDRRGEYSPLGRNIANAGPYLTINTEQPADEAGVNLFGTGQGYRPGQQTYAINGLAVSADRFMDEINTGAIGGIFGLLEIASRLSARRFAGYTLRYTDHHGGVREIWGGYSFQGAVSRMEGGETIVRNWFVSDTWGVSRLFTVYHQRGQSSGGGGRNQEKLNTGPKAESDEATINKKLDDCINQIFGGTVKDWRYSYDRSQNSGTISFTPVVPGGDAIPGIGEITATTFFTRTARDLAVTMNTETSTNFGLQSGYTSPGQLNFNWIAKEVANDKKKYGDIGFKALFIHEMGNMIANILNRDGWRNGQGRENANSYNVKDPDIGQTLENCVFGGRVGLQTGQLGPNREL